MTTDARHERWMREALLEAERALSEGEVPVGAVIANASGLVARAHNLCIALTDTSAHAEMLVLRAAQKALCRPDLSDCALYVTLEPCPMCAGAVLHARLGNVYYGAADPRAGAMGSVYLLTGDPALPDRVPAYGGLLSEECGAVLRRFFAEARGK